MHEMNAWQRGRVRPSIFVCYVSKSTERISVVCVCVCVCVCTVKFFEYFNFISVLTNGSPAKIVVHKMKYRCHWDPQHFWSDEYVTKHE